jgi:hypothetical protein
MATQPSYRHLPTPRANIWQQQVRVIPMNEAEHRPGTPEVGEGANKPIDPEICLAPGCGHVPSQVCLTHGGSKLGNQLLGDEGRVG